MICYLKDKSDIIWLLRDLEAPLFSVKGWPHPSDIIRFAGIGAAKKHD